MQDIKQSAMVQPSANKPEYQLTEIVCNEITFKGCIHLTKAPWDRLMEMFLCIYALIKKKI